MRVISQDGTLDVPYEISSLSMAVGKYENVEHALSLPQLFDSNGNKNG